MLCHYSTTTGDRVARNEQIVGVLENVLHTLQVSQSSAEERQKATEVQLKLGLSTLSGKVEDLTQARSHTHTHTHIHTHTERETNIHTRAHQ